MILLLAVPTILCFALCLGAVLGLTGRVARLAGWFILSWAALVFSAEVCALAGRLETGSLLAVLLVLALFSVLAWFSHGKPDLIAPFRAPIHFPPFKKQPWLYLFGGAVGVAYLAGLLLIFLVPPNTVDSMTYHLARVGYWVQQRSFFPWPTNDPRQTSFPINTEIGLMASILFSGSDRLAGMVQWLAAGACALTVYGGAVLLGARRPQALFAVLVWASFPEVFFQSTSTQNDLAASAFFACAVFFLLLYMKSEQSQMASLSGLALGLAIGAKSTVLLILPGLALAALFFLFWRGRRSFPRLLAWAAACLAGFLLLGAYSYVQNWLAYGNPFSVSEWVPSVGASSSRLSQFGAASFIHLYQFADPSGLPDALAVPLAGAKAAAVQRVELFSQYHLPHGGALRASLPDSLIQAAPGFNEDQSWFGPLGFLLLTIAFVYHLVVAVRSRDPYRFLPGVLVLAFFLAISYLLFPTLYRGRYFVLPVTAAAPALYIFYPGRRRWLFMPVLIAILSIFILGRTALQNPSKPVLSSRPFWTQDAVDLQTVNRRDIAPVLRMVAAAVPLDAPLALKTGLEGWDYPFFGPALRRSIFQLDPRLSVDAAELHRRGEAYLLVEPGERSFLAVPGGLEWVGQASDWTLYRVTDAPAIVSPEVQSYLLGAADSTGLVAVEPALQGQVGVVQAGGQHWGIEQYQGLPLLWIGEDPPEGLWFTLTTPQARSVRLSFDLTPGPGLAGGRRSFALVQSQGLKTSAALTQTADTPAVLTFDVHLAPGTNRFTFYSLDYATLRKQPNGDQRPLLALLHKATVSPAP